MWSLKHWFSRLATPNGHASQGVSQVDISHVDHEAIVIEAIAPKKPGWVHFQSTSWSAYCLSGATLQPGQRVYVVSRYNTTLYVEPTFEAIDLDAISVFWIGF